MCDRPAPSRPKGPRGRAGGGGRGRAGGRPWLRGRAAGMRQRRLWRRWAGARRRETLAAGTGGGNAPEAAMEAVGHYPNPRALGDAYSGRRGRRGRGNRARAQVSRQLYACRNDRGLPRGAR